MALSTAKKIAMTQQLVQINFRFKLPIGEYEETTQKLAIYFSRLPDLHWKIWLMNEENNEAGGIYLFKNAAAVEAYRKSELFRNLETAPFISSISFKQFDIMESQSLATNMPVEERMIRKSPFVTG